MRLCAVNPVGGTGDAVEASKMTLAEGMQLRISILLNILLANVISELI